MTTSLGTIGTAVTASDADRIRVGALTETTPAAGLSGAGTVSPGGEERIFSTTPDVAPAGTEQFYLVSAVVSSNAGHAFRVGFATGGVSTSLGGLGTAVTAADADRLAIIPATPVLVAFSGATQPTFTPTLDWADAAGAATYALQYDGDGSFTSPSSVSGLTASAYTMPTPLADGTYFWRVKAEGNGEESPYSPADSFAIIPLFGGVVLLALSLGMVAYVWLHRR